MKEIIEYYIALEFKYLVALYDRDVLQGIEDRGDYMFKTPAHRKQSNDNFDKLERKAQLMIIENKLSPTKFKQEGRDLNRLSDKQIIELYEAFKGSPDYEEIKAKGLLISEFKEPVEHKRRFNLDF